MLKLDIVREATRLTRAGQLVEATVLLQRMLRDEGRARGDIAAPPVASLLQDASRQSLTREPIPLRRRIVRTQRRPHPLHRACSTRCLIARRNPLGSDCEVRLSALRRPGRTSCRRAQGSSTGTYSNPTGSRAYRLFIPSRYQGQPLPLVVMLHGCTQSPDDFAAGTRMNFIAEEQTCFVVYPAQRSEANQAKCWNWFRTADQQRERR